MKCLLFLASLSVLVIGAFKPVKPSDEPVTLVIGGDVLGYLAPCGCTKPMVGGIRRWATAVRAVQSQGKAVVLVNGGVAGGLGRQHELKSETLAESFKSLSIQALNLSAHEANLGKDALIAIQRLSGGVLTTMSLAPSETLDASNSVEAGPFLIGGLLSEPMLVASVLGERPTVTDTAVDELVLAAKSKGLKPVAMWSGGEAGARTLAQRHPELVAVTYSDSSVPRGKPMKEGDTWLLTPGEKGRTLVTARWNGTEFEAYQTVELGPEIKDDDEVSRAYHRYLERVADEDLLMKLPRSPGARFAGNDKCFPCHEAAANVWKTSKHAVALATLESEGHDKDPDCVGCHVVGLESDTGFMTRAKTPHLTDVGCESCHGPGALHAEDPPQNKLGQAGLNACMKCHVTEHSPNFDFSTYWEKIKH